MENKIKEIITSRTSGSELAQIIDYAMFPAGKLFRPKLVMAMAEDLNNVTNDHYLLAAAIETHHAYSLVHDDLPCMDNDEFRRGKLSTHKKYGEWKALLAGDAMISLSYEILASMNSPKAKDLIIDFTKSMGSLGLIRGQFIDLSHSNKSFEQTLKMHELKTGRLIQYSLNASHKLCGSPLDEQKINELGTNIGINFQLLDDLGELVEEVGEHEENVNAFLNYDAKEVLETCKSLNESIFETLRECKLEKIGFMYQIFLNKTSTKISSGIDKIISSTALSKEALDSLFSAKL